jgi:ribonuclease Z
VIAITLLGTGSPLPDPHRAGPSTLVSAAGEHYLVDAGRGALMRLAAAGVPVGQLTAVLVTHLHSDHLTDLNDVITTHWISTFQPTPLHVVGPPGTRRVVDHLLAALEPDIGYRLAHHADLTEGPIVEVTELTELSEADGFRARAGAAVAITAAPTDHRPVEPSVAFRLEHAGASVVLAGDTVPCASLDALATGAGALVHTVIRKDVIGAIPIQRLQDTLDYHSSPEEAGGTATRAGVGTLVLTHYVPAFPPGDDDQRAAWHALAAAHFTGRIEVGDDLHRIEIHPDRPIGA